MRINAVKKRLLSDHVDDIQRRYPLVSPEAWPGNLTENRANLWLGDSPVYPLLQRPIIECIPQYIRDTEHGETAVDKIRNTRGGAEAAVEHHSNSREINVQKVDAVSHQWQSLVAYLGKHDGGHWHRFRKTEPASIRTPTRERNP